MDKHQLGELGQLTVVFSGLLVHQGEILVHSPCPPAKLVEISRGKNSQFTAFGTAVTQPSICGGHVFQDLLVVILIACGTPPKRDVL